MQQSTTCTHENREAESSFYYRTRPSRDPDILLVDDSDDSYHCHCFINFVIVVRILFRYVKNCFRWPDVWSRNRGRAHLLASSN
jgi:hypothetical protein